MSTVATDVIAAPRPAAWRAADMPWLTVIAAVTTIELLWWLTAWLLGIASAPHLLIYVAMAFAELAAAAAMRIAVGLRPSAAPWPAALTGAALVGIGASAFLPLKHAIPAEVPFWLDRPIALAERSLFHGDPWQMLNHAFGWATVPMDWLYGSWLPLQSVVVFLVILSRPSPAKSRALVAYSLAWFLLGVLAAALLSSAGPLFFDRLYGGHEFAALHPVLSANGAHVALAESDLMWAAVAERSPGLVAGISAMPSIHVAVSLWIWLTARVLAPRVAPFALIYFTLIWIGSVQLGWHYATDGLAGALGMLAVWQLAKLVQVQFARRRAAA